MSDLALAIDLGGTLVRAALIDASGRILTQAVDKTNALEGPLAVTDQIAVLAGQVMQGSAVKGVGMWAPGPLDTITGRVFGMQTPKGFEDFSQRGALQDRLGLPVQVENDGIAGVLAELCHGAGQGVQDYI